MTSDHALSVLHRIRNRLDDDQDLIERGHMRGDLLDLQEQKNALDVAIATIVHDAVSECVWCGATGPLSSDGVCDDCLADA